jgi:hypothetical protein
MLMRSADAALASYPKAGRTWLRYIIGTYFNEACGLGITVDLESIFQIIPNRDLDPRRGLPAWRFSARRNVPLVVVSHEPYSLFTFGRLPMLFMVRDPRDLMVSAYFHHSRHKHRLAGTMSEFLRDPNYGLNSLIRYLNGFAAGLPRHRHLVLSYEELSLNPHPTMTRVLDFLNVVINDAVLERALAASHFEAMREAELRTGIPGHTYDRSDPDSLRIRRGKIGNFREHLSDADLLWVQRRCADALDPPAMRLLHPTGFRV